MTITVLLFFVAAIAVYGAWRVTKAILAFLESIDQGDYR